MEMSNKKHQIPAIRFNGFTDAWEQRKASNIFVSVSEKNNPELPVLSASQEKGMILRYTIGIDIKYDKKSLNTYKKVSPGQFVIHLRSFQGGFAYSEIEGITSPAYTVIDFKNKESYYPTFWRSILTSTTFIKKLETVTYGIRDGRSISFKDFSTLKFNVPKYNEQIKIGTFFNNLDDAIALHQRKLELLKEQKTGFLQKMFPKNGSNVPEIRFSGFTEDWEQRKLDDVSEKVTEKNKNRKVTETLTNSAEYGIISQSDFFDKDISNINNIDGYYVVRPDDFVYNPRISNYAPVGPIKRNNLNKIGVMSPLYYVFRIKDIDPSFLEKYFDTAYWHMFMKLNGDSGARADRFAIKDSVFKQMPIPYPSIEEQVKLGNFFKQLDDTIALHQRKLELLKEQKTGFLQKMFPKNGSNVPEIRFSGFTEDWEQRKLDDVSEKVTEKNKNRKVTETLTNSAEYGIISQSDFFDKDISNINNIDGYYVVRPDDFVYNPRISNYAPVGPIKRNNLNKIGVMSPLYYVFRIKDIDPSFLEKYFDTAYWHMFMKLNGDSGARADRFAIKDSVFKQMPIPYPSIEEQVKLGNFFKQLDDTIALHQQKINDYLQLKNAMLQQLFV